MFSNLLSTWRMVSVSASLKTLQWIELLETLQKATVSSLYFAKNLLYADVLIYIIHEATSLEIELKKTGSRCCWLPSRRFMNAFVLSLIRRNKGGILFLDASGKGFFNPYEYLYISTTSTWL